jgi:hypothetical protein
VKRRKELQLSTASINDAGFHPRVKAQPAGWVKVQPAPTRQATIVNLSLKSTVPIYALEKNLDDSSSRLLFITAAGNQGKELRRDASTEVEAPFPALNKLKCMRHATRPIPFR